MLFYRRVRLRRSAEATTMQRRSRQLGLFEPIPTSRTIPQPIEDEVLGLLVQLLESMIPVIEKEARDEQDRG
jgi:hypothetical protein